MNFRPLLCACARLSRSIKLTAMANKYQNYSHVNVVAGRSFSGSSSINASAKVRVMKNPVRLTPSRAPLVLTPKAVSRVKELLAERPNVIGLRVSVRQRGCSGLTYTLDYVEDQNKSSQAVNHPDEPVNPTAGTSEISTVSLEKDIGRTSKQSHDIEVVQDGVKIFIDRRAQLTLLGTEMDFVETKMAAEFIFTNPNIKSTCGCGESFMLS